MRIVAGLLGVALFLGGCEPLPRDPEGTLDRVKASHRIRVGMVADPIAFGAKRADALLSSIGHEVGAQTQITPGSTERLLDALRHDELDLVIGPFTKDTPWAADVALGPAIALTGIEDRQIALRAVARNGENKWVMLIERTSKAIAPVESKR